jgi:hypothetical protein
VRISLPTSGFTMARGIADLLRDGYQFALVSNSDIWSAFNDRPFGAPLQRIDFRRTHPMFADQAGQAKFLRLFIKANALSFGSRGLEMPHWVMIDLAVAPSALVLLLASPERVLGGARALIGAVGDRPAGAADHARIRAAAALTDLLGVAGELGYQGPLPVAGYCAAATPVPGRWMGWSAWSLVPGRGLGYLMKRLAIECYGASALSGITQFDNTAALHLHLKFGMLEITSAKISSHTAPYSFAYSVQVGNLPEDGSAALVTQSATDQFDLADIDSWVSVMQAEIENGTYRHFILPATDAATISIYKEPL